jgi:TRAP-type uncharacterized transport system substrate-binding protein
MNMKSNLRGLAAFLLASVMASAAWAQPAKAPAVDYTKFKVLIGTGGETATYHTMVGVQLANICARDTTFGFKPQDGGTTANIDDILNNKLDAGVGQEDSLFLKKATNPAVNGLKAILNLHPEEVHVFVQKDTGLRQPDIVTTKYMGMKEERTPGAPIVFNKVDDTGGQNVVTWGGSFDTARLISANAGLNWNVQRVKDLDAALTEVKAGRAEVILAVGGAPVGSFEKIPASAGLKLVPFSDALVTKLVAYYNGGATLNYSNLESEGVKTISTNAVLFTREYTDPEMLNALAEFRACATAAIPKLRDTRGMHAKWRQVVPGSKPKWQWYDLPAVKAVAKK